MKEITTGKSERSLCVPQYFAWVNHGNDGSTEDQTLKNLEFFAYLKREYGMRLEIYALDAGNFDSPVEYYFDPDHPMAKQNFPNWLGPVAARAKELDIKLGMWCGPDGFGDTEESEKRRFEQVVSLCRDYNVALLKFDLVCGPLRKEKHAIFERMIAECRKYCPELIVLNHRIDLGEAQKYATTFLWEGRETYVDVLINNVRTAPHHRQGALERGLVPGLQRLTEDHGVCISSCIDFFEDDLVLQAFNRALILSPEIYGTPAFLRDDEFPRLARIYNLSEKYADLLIHGIQLPEAYGDFAVSRGDGETRIVTLRNNTWTPFTVNVRFDELGLEKTDTVTVLQYFPTQRLIGTYAYGETVPVTVDPFRVCMFAAGRVREDVLLGGCDYEVVKDLPGEPVTVNIIRSEEIRVLSNGYKGALLNGKPVDFKQPVSVHTDEYLYPPVKLGTLAKADVPENAEMLYEINSFGVDNDSQERRAVRRSGETKIEEVRAVREAFFLQPAYHALGCDHTALFDGDPDTFFDAISRMCNLRVSDGCLRIDLKEVYDIDGMEIEYFDDPEENPYSLIKNLCPESGTASVDLCSWIPFCRVGTEVVGEANSPSVQQNVERIRYVAGKRVKTQYQFDAPVRYIRLPSPMDRIYAIRFYKNGSEIKTSEMPAANNLMASYTAKEPRAALSGTVKLPAFKHGSYLSIACEGTHGIEGVYFTGSCGETILGCPDRAPAYPANTWGHWVCKVSENYTYYMLLPDELCGKELQLTGLICKDGEENFHADVYLCHPNDAKQGAELILER